MAQPDLKKAVKPALPGGAGTCPFELKPEMYGAFHKFIQQKECLQTIDKMAGMVILIQNVIKTEMKKVACRFAVLL